MPDIKSWILSNSKFGLADPCTLQIWITLWLRMSDLFHIGYHGKTCSLPLLNFVGHTLEWIALHIPQLMGTYVLGSSCRCGTCPHSIWVSWCTPNNPEGIWSYLIPLLWPLRQHSYIWPRSPSWYYLTMTIWKMKDVSDTPSHNHFHHEIILLRTWIPLAPVILDPPKLILQKLTHIPPVLMTS